MNGIMNSEDVTECPLCMEQLDVDDINFYPCTCGYQICRFCWHRIRTDENELCPACRKAYSENPAEFKPLSEEQMTALKTEKRQRDQRRKQKITENRKHLANVRVVQKNLVFVVGLPPRLAEAEILKKHEYFGKYGKIHKVVINPCTTYAGVQGPSASAYVTYCSNNDALRAIQSVNNIMIDGRLIKTSLGTTKYCSHFMKNLQCPKPDCMYLHDLGDGEASFTKEEMHQGKHQEYEKRLHDALIAQTTAANTANSNGKNDETKPIDTPNGLAQNNKEAWPCLSVSPVNKEAKVNGKVNKDVSAKKTKSEKGKSKKATTNGTQSNGKENGFNSSKDTSSVSSDTTDKQKTSMDADEELNLISELENDALCTDDMDGKASITPSLSTSSSSGDSGSLSETASGKTSPGSFPDHSLQNGETNHDFEQQNKTNLEKSSLLCDKFGVMAPITSEINTNCHSLTNGMPNVIDTTARFSKLGLGLSLFDDNNSFFSTNNFSPYFKMDQHRNTDSTTSTNSPQLPDLLNGTESNKERQEIDKLNIIKGLGEFNQVNNLQGYNNSAENWEAFKYAMSKNKQQSQPHQQQQQQQQQQHQLETDELHELQKRNNYINSLGISHFNGLPNDFNNDYFHNPNESSRFSQMQLQNQNHPRQQPNGIHSSDNLNHSYTGNMSKFFDFHKNQQQQQSQQNQYFNGGSRSDHMNLLENHRLNSQFLDHTNNGLLGSHIHKQRMMNKFDQLGSPQHQQPQLNHNLLHNQQPNNRLPNHFSSSATSDDDLEFDIFLEARKGLAEIIENESQQSQPNRSKLIENCQRTRLPPPGFNHMNAFGLGVPRAQGNKISPFMNMGNSAQSPQGSNWGPQQQQNLGYQNHDQIHLSQQNHQLNKGGYGAIDWTALDPAIVSFRQFPSFGQSQQQQQQQQQQSLMPHMNQPQLGGLYENKLKNIDFSNRNGMLGGFGGPHGINLQNSIINQQQQSSQAQVNYSHSSWLNTDQPQNIFMNNLSNGFSNNFEKFSIPMPPGFQNTGNKPQKADNIN